MDARTISYQVDADGRRYFTNADMARMVEDGLIDPDDRWELLRGEWFDMPSEGWPHMIARTRLNQIFSSALGYPGAWLVNSEGSVHPFHDTELRPDMIVFRADVGTNEMRGADIALVVEIMASSQRRDMTRKRPIYAEAGAPELWLMDLDANIVHVFTRPDGADYAEHRQAGVDDVVSPAAFPEIKVKLADLTA